MEQTNRTILFEEVNPDKMNLLDLVDNSQQKASLTDYEVQEIHQELVVESFEEFIHKFIPDLYINVDYEKKSFLATFHESNGQAVKYSLKEKNSLLQMFLQMLRQKDQKEFTSFQFQHFLEYMIGNGNHNALMELRTEISNQINAGQKEKLNTLFQSALENSKNSIQLLKLFIEDTNRILLIHKQTEDIKPIVLKDDSRMQVQLMSISDKFMKTEALLTEEKALYYQELLQEYLEDNPVHHKKLLYYFLLLPYIKILDLEEEFVSEYKAAMEFYEKVTRILWYQYKPLLETTMGIYSFFHQYGHTKGEMPPGLLIANCSTDSILDSKNQEKLRIYLETVNNKNFLSETIWYCILPKVSIGKLTRPKVQRTRFLSTNETILEKGNETEEIQVLTDILSEYQIQTFLSVQGGEASSFRGILKDGLDEINLIFEPLKKMETAEYMIPCYPNFTVLPKEFAAVSLGYPITYDEMGDIRQAQPSKKKVWLTQIVIEASYVAAGFYAACQEPAYLETYYPKKVVKDMPGVSYQALREQYSQAIPTTMASEIFSCPEEFIEDMQRKSYGIFFAPYKNRIYIHTDRTLAVLFGKKDTVANIQTLTYMDRVIRKTTQDYKMHLIEQFFQNRPNSIRAKWEQNQKCVNAIIKEGEALSYTIDKENDTCTFHVAFRSEVKDKMVRLSK